MLIKNITTTFNDYKKTGMLVAFPKCDFKCCIESGIPISVCQNCHLATSKSVELSATSIVDKYDPTIHHALICGGLEPLDSEIDLLELLYEFRMRYDDDIVIFTGYKLEEISQKVLTIFRECGNIIMKVGRYIPDGTAHFDEVTGVSLASSNQYGIRVDDLNDYK